MRAKPAIELPQGVRFGSDSGDREIRERQHEVWAVYLLHLVYFRGKTFGAMRSNAFHASDACRKIGTEKSAIRGLCERKYRALLLVSGAFVVRMAQNFEWIEQLRLQHATLPGAFSTTVWSNRRSVVSPVARISGT